MKVTVYSTKAYDREFLQAANAAHSHELLFLEAGLNEHTAALADGSPAVSAFTNDTLNRAVLEQLHRQGTRVISLRAAGFNNVDLKAAAELGLTVVRVPAYSPYAVAEHTVGLILTLNRKLHRAVARVREQNFSLDGLMGFDLHGRTVGVVGTGRIGIVVCRIMNGFGCRVLAHDPFPTDELDGIATYTTLPELLRESDIITLQCPLTPETHHLIDDGALASMKPGVMLINTSRGAVVDTKAAIRALKSGHLGYFGIDVYEEEGDLFFRDLSQVVLQDDVFARLLTFPNVVVTAHQAFFTREALTNIAETTLQNIADFEAGAVREANRVSDHLIR
ncbi:MAG: D-lactate dehydrogenase [Phycisphaerales bacterium]|jgi:D-lactate dehydrogenase